MAVYRLFLAVSAFVAIGLVTAERLTYTDVIDTSKPDEEVELDITDFIEAEEQPEVNLTQELGIPMQSSSSKATLEGDMAGKGISPEGIKDFLRRSNSLARNAIKDSWKRWPNGEIPYKLSSRYGSYSKRIIAKAFNEYHKNTCIKFVPRDRSKHRDYVYIHPDDGCYSLVGKTGGRQPLSLDAGCIQTGTIMHELMHTSGFFHEQSRADRDDYITIVMSNVMPDAADQFDAYSLRMISHLGSKYDYNSIMHYGPYAFSKNGRKTILAKKAGASKMGQREGFSETDIEKLNKLYKCPTDGEDSGEGTPPEEITARPAPSDDCKDKKWQCYFWSLGVIDYCGKYEKVRLEICPKSCGTCTAAVVSRPATTTETPEDDKDEDKKPKPKPTKTTCKDLNPACERWAKYKFCKKSGYTSYMKKKCPKSCEACANKDQPQKELLLTSAPEVSREQESGECADKPGHDMICRMNKLLRRCNSSQYEAVMRRDCSKTCLYC